MYIVFQYLIPNAPGTENNQSIKSMSRRNILSFLRKRFGFLLDKSFFIVLDVITQHIGNVDPSKGLIHRFVKVNTILLEFRINIISSLLGVIVFPY
jgi:hypothetical protein